ncbi:hypothetical protein DACRYDRAFT_20181 [Dacryopinax primogenitus]|uniref:Uncharacterized protein n=1 Tax=Dacryopinax primogenitus (strain DJM 731) TaxID=1858805 RepID=M5GGN7_DACPD|nr:uncharacterized protein DACRYDRAFT_20181 [Dacryopinax primogenitus]EJU05808.1 hypothetical protein DACRYDRAFT_20181 [Dacryopinax primogenitus]
MQALKHWRTREYAMSEAMVRAPVDVLISLGCYHGSGCGDSHFGYDVDLLWSRS